MDADEQDEEPSVTLSLKNVKGLAAVLQAIKPGSKQTCCVVVGPEGLNIRWEDDAKTLQSAVFLRPELFSSFSCQGGKQVLGLMFAQLVDTLSVFASSSDAELLLQYPGPDGELQMEMTDPGGEDGQALTTYAHLACLEVEVPQDLTDYWEDPTSYFLAPGAVLKEAVEDLEWPNGPVTIRLERNPPRISFKATGTGTLEVELNTQELSGFQVSEQLVTGRYKYKNLKAALSNIPAGVHKGAGSVSTKISMDANGLLKVTHMVVLSGGAGAGGAGHMQPSVAGLASLATQNLMDHSRVGVVQFVTQPLEDEEGAA